MEAASPGSQRDRGAFAGRLISSQESRGGKSWRRKSCQKGVTGARGKMMPPAVVSKCLIGMYC